MDPRLHSILCLRTEVLKLGEDGDYADAPPDPNFFLPLPREKLREHTVEILNDVDRQEYQDHEEEAYPGPDEDAIDRAQFLSYRIDREFCEFPRKGIEAGTLRGGSVWLGTGDVLDNWFWRDMFPAGRKFHFTSGWKVKRGLLPHVTLNIRHDVDAEEDLLRGEVLALIGAMLTRLDMKEWKQHIVIPVMLFSFMSNIQGRILQGYFDGREVVIRKTKLYDFFPREEMDASTEVFLQWMASTPCGDTKNFQLREFAPLTVLEEERLDNEWMMSGQ
ncbi:hypothetical protein CDV55_107152 [Aspergillus turcosus]|nr:hypothetical protein CDV55_107152 [Aspergillus turcosus]